MRFMVMAAERAATIATMIQAIWRQAGKPPSARAASNAPTSANGRAKTECSNFIISRTVRIRPLVMFQKQNRGARFGLAPVPAGLLPSRNRQIHTWRPDISSDRDGIARRAAFSLPHTCELGLDDCAGNREKSRAARMQSCPRGTHTNDVPETQRSSERLLGQ